MKLPNFKKTLPIFSGIEMGIPLNIISKISNAPVSQESILLNFLLGFSTYKQDRYLDSLEYSVKNNITKLSDVNEIMILNNSKTNYYISIVENEKLVQLSLFCSYISLCTIALYYQIGIIFPLFTSTFLYKNLKENDNTSFLKPFYVAGMWTLCTCYIPHLLQDTSSLNSDFIPTFLNIFALSNYQDLKDYDEDLLNGINTLPIILGPLKTKAIIGLSLGLSFLLYYII